MKNTKQKLLISQIDSKLDLYKPLVSVSVPEKGWIHTIRTAYKMSLRQLGVRLNITAPSADSIEKREKDKSITLKSLEEAGKALNLKFVYGFIPMEGSLEKSIEKRAKEMAIDIVQSTSHTMALENQENSKERLAKAIQEKTTELTDEMPRFLWD